MNFSLGFYACGNHVRLIDRRSRHLSTVYCSTRCSIKIVFEYAIAFVFYFQCGFVDSFKMDGKLNNDSVKKESGGVRVWADGW